jgi:hypothetical protein
VEIEPRLYGIYFTKSRTLGQRIWDKVRCYGEPFREHIGNLGTLWDCCDLDWNDKNSNPLLLPQPQRKNWALD